MTFKSNKETISGLKFSLQHINNLTRNNPRVIVVLGGDFNARGIDWDNNTAKPGVEHRPICESILETLSEHGLEQLQKSPTRKDSILDLYCTNKPGLVKSICNIPGFSSEDHEFLVVDSWVKPEVLKKTPRKFHKWSKYDWSSMTTDTKSWANEWLKSSVHEQLQRTTPASVNTFSHLYQSTSHTVSPRPRKISLG